MDPCLPSGSDPDFVSGQRILRTLERVPRSLTKRYEPVFTRLAVVKGSLRLASYQHVRPPSWPHLRVSKKCFKKNQPRFRMPPSDKRDTRLPPPHTLAIRKNVGY